MNLKQLFLLLFLVTTFQNNLFCAEKFKNFQNDCAMPIAFIIAGATLFGVNMSPLIKSFSDFLNPDAQGPYAWGSKNKGLAACSCSSVACLLFVFHGMALLSGVHNQYKDKINA
jgi:hypothetical protein